MVIDESPYKLADYSSKDDLILRLLMVEENGILIFGWNDNDDTLYVDSEFIINYRGSVFAGSPNNRYPSNKKLIITLHGDEDGV